ncbi:hypothetical protein ABEW05_009979 [Botrytis cinerea]
MTTLAPSSTSPENSESPSPKQARVYLNNLLCKTLLVHTTDHRMFRGEFKCTDSVRLPSFICLYPSPSTSSVVCNRSMHELPSQSRAYVSVKRKRIRGQKSKEQRAKSKEEEEEEEKEQNKTNTSPHNPQDLNIILSETYEYRIPPTPPPAISPDPNSNSNSTTLQSQSQSQSQPQPQPQPLLNITPRWLGLVVVPGAHILRIELEEFESQVRGRKS